MLVTSTFEVLSPCGNELISMLLDNSLNLSKFFLREIVILGKFDLSFQPEFRLRIT